MKMSTRYQDYVLIAHTYWTYQGPKVLSILSYIYVYSSEGDEDGEKKIGNVQCTPQQPNQPFTFIVA